MARLKNRRACCHGNGHNELLSCLMKTEILSVVAEQYSERETPFLARCVAACADAGAAISAVFSPLLSKQLRWVHVLHRMQMVMNVLRACVLPLVWVCCVALQVRLPICFVAVSSLLVYPQVRAESAEVH